jgi:copper transport protein
MGGLLAKGARVVAAPIFGAVAFASAVLCLLVFASVADAHALLVGTSPARGVTEKSQPKLIVFRFSEPVESSFGAVRVFDAKGRQVEAGQITHPRGQSSVAIGLSPKLAKGSYTATYHVISADSHPVSGGFVFSIGKPGATPQTVAQLTSKDKVAEATQIGFGFARGVSYAAIALALGALAFLIWSWLPALRSTAGGDARWLEASERFARRLRGLLVLALLAGVVSEACQLVFQGATATGGTFWDAIDGTVIREVIHTRFGTVHLLHLIAFSFFLLLSLPRSWAPVLKPASVGATGLAAQGFGRVELLLMGALGAFLAISTALGGHAATESPTALLIPTDALHVAAMSIWVGGLVVLLFVLPAATRVLDSPDRTRLLAAILLRFSPLALAAFSTILVSGVVQGYVHVRSVDHLIHTGYGRAVLAKAILLSALIATGAYNRQRAIPGLKALAAGGQPTGAAGLGLRRSLRAEVGLVAVVIAITSVLVSYAPPTATSSGPFAATKALGPLQLQMTIDPASTGSNVMHLYLLNAKDGSQFTGSKEMTVLLSQPDKKIGPIKADARKGGPGHYVVLGANFVPGGTWKVQIVDRVSAFDQYQTTVDVPIR